MLYTDFLCECKFLQLLLNFKLSPNLLILFVNSVIVNVSAYIVMNREM